MLDLRYKSYFLFSTFDESICKKISGQYLLSFQISKLEPTVNLLLSKLPKPEFCWLFAFCQKTKKAKKPKNFFTNPDYITFTVNQALQELVNKYLNVETNISVKSFEYARNCDKNSKHIERVYALGNVWCHDV